MAHTTTLIPKHEKLLDMKEKSENITNVSNEDEIPRYEKYKFLIWEFERPLVWPNIILFVISHTLSMYFLVTYPYYSKPGLVLYGFLIGSIAGFGLTAGAHRYYTHRSFKAKLPLRVILLFCYTVAGQYSLKEWVRDHRVHHKFSETNADPHNSRRGFFFAHAGWLLMQKHPEVIKKSRQMDVSDLFEDPLVVFHQKYFIWLRLLFCFILPTMIPPLVWGESWYHTIKAVVFVRHILTLNMAWLVNSAAHMWGTKPYDMRIKPVENTIISYLTFGEGYHNYHHTFPWDYRAAEIGKFFNFTTFCLNIFNKIGWAYDMKSPSQELVIKVAKNYGDETLYKWGHEVPYEQSEKLIEQVKKPL